MVCAFWAKCHSNGEFFEKLPGKNVACKATHIRYGPEVKGRFCVGSLGERYSKRKWLSYRSKQIDVCETAVSGPCNTLRWIVKCPRENNMEIKTFNHLDIEATTCSIRSYLVSQFHWQHEWNGMERCGLNPTEVKNFLFDSNTEECLLTATSLLHTLSSGRTKTQSVIFLFKKAL